jgi:trk system potassium uptake protein TrkH
MVFAWITLIFLGSLWILLRTDLTGYQALSGMTSAVSNIGPFFFSVDKMISLPIDIKMLFGIGMLAGRLEMFPMLILFSRKR